MAKKSIKKRKKHIKKPSKKRKVVKRKLSKKKVVRSAVRNAKAKANSQKAISAEALIEKGKERGYVTYSEILKSFPHVEGDISFLESLYERFSIAGVDVLEGGMLEDAAY